jgi:hypothetical protein
MMSERALVDAIFETALEGCEADVGVRRNALWIAAITLLADVLLSYDPFNRERLLRGLEHKLRDSVGRLSQCMAEETAKLNLEKLEKMWARQTTTPGDANDHNQSG